MEEPVESAPEPAPVATAPPSAAVPEPPRPEEPSAGLDDIEVVPPPPVADTPPPLPEPTPAPAPAAETPSSTGTFRFGKRDPTDKAKRLARVLVSDMIMYNAERHRTALEDGTLAQDFEDEIEKSWKEFVEQVGPELAEGPGRSFWREALNDILAKGQEVF